MQPYFFPYLGYLSLIKHTDRMILLDDVQFIRHGWIERNRILKPEAGWQYISVPLKKKSFTTAIKDVEINNETAWKDKILRQVAHYKKKAPFYRKTVSVIEDAISGEPNNIAELNLHILNTLCCYLGINANIEIFSSLNMEIEPPCAPDEWALNICKKIKSGVEYWNPIGGQQFFSKEKYNNSNIKLVFHNAKLTPYEQLDSGMEFESGLSIIDVMMFNSPEDISTMLDCYECI